MVIKPSQKDALVAEMSIMKQSTHENVVAFYGAYNHDGKIWVRIPPRIHNTFQIALGGDGADGCGMPHSDIG